MTWGGGVQYIPYLMGVAGYLRKGLEPILLGTRMRWDLSRSDKEGMEFPSLRKVCCSLGPNRNLTTLVAGMMASHPQCRVLNHAGKRIFPLPEVNFLVDYAPGTFERFIRYAVYLSDRGKHGLYGGSIEHSHAFETSKMRTLHDSWSPRKEPASGLRVLYWKESAVLTRYVRENRVSLKDLVKLEPRLCFLMPVRNPLDCASSIVKKGRARLHLGDVSITTVEAAIEAILQQLAWFLDLRDACPDNCFTFTERDLNRETIVQLAAFLDINCNEEWMSDCLKTWDLKPGYQHSPAHVAHYRVLLERYFDQRPAWRERLSEFAPDS